MQDSTFYSRHEQAFAEWARSEGWRVTKQGWPDFICRRNGEVMAVEVKGGSDGLRSEQIDAIRDLKRAGFPAFLWTPEWGLSEVRGSTLTESVPSLLAEIANLRSLVADVVDLRARVAKVPKDPVRRVRWADEDALCMKELTEWCEARHEKHRGQVFRADLGFCAWLVYLASRQPIVEVAVMVGLEIEDTERFLKAATAKRDVWLHNLRHKILQEGEVCADCARAA